MKKLMIIGAGSIGKRHLDIANRPTIQDANEISSVSLVSKYHESANYRTIIEGIKTFKPTHILLATKTADHFNDFEIINENISGIDVLIEKPLFSKPEKIKKLNNNYFVAYNLRFSKIIEELKNISIKNKILHAEIYVGSYLPHWRPDIDYRKNYSAKYSEGGGVLRDLSHELDYIVYLFGKIKNLSSIVSKISSLEIDSEDLATIILECYSGTIVTLTMNYISKIPIRKISMISNTDTYIADILRSDIKNSNKNTIIKDNIDDIYISQINSFLTNKNKICGIEEGIYTTTLIEAIENASNTKEWVTL